MSRIDDDAPVDENPPKKRPPHGISSARPFVFFGIRCRRCGSGSGSRSRRRLEIRLHRDDRAEQGRDRRLRGIRCDTRPPGAPHRARAGRERDLHRDRLAHDRLARELDGQSRSAAQLHRRRMDGGGCRASRPPAGHRGTREARDHRPRPRLHGHVDLRRRPHPRQVPRSASRLVGHLGEGDHRGESVRRPRQRAALRDRREHHGGARDRGHLLGRHPRDHGRVCAPPHPGTHPQRLEARAAQAARHRADRGPELQRRRQPHRVAELVTARRLQLPGGDDAAPGDVRGRREHPLDCPPPVVQRDGRAVPRPERRPLPPHRLRHRRVGPRIHDDLARARLRLPRRDPVPRRRAARQHRGAVHDPERVLHPRGGRGRALEARRPRRGR